MPVFVDAPYHGLGAGGTDSEDGKNEGVKTVSKFECGSEPGVVGKPVSGETDARLAGEGREESLVLGVAQLEEDVGDKDRGGERILYK